MTYTEWCIWGIQQYLGTTSPQRTRDLSPMCLYSGDKSYFLHNISDFSSSIYNAPSFHLVYIPVGALCVAVMEGRRDYISLPIIVRITHSSSLSPLPLTPPPPPPPTQNSNTQIHHLLTTVMSLKFKLCYRHYNNYTQFNAPFLPHIAWLIWPV